jgi:nickel/cobalt exporter
MGLAALYGVGSGALHAVTGPDHVLSLGPAALSHPRRSFAIGLNWGLGHALGTLALSVPLLFVARFATLESFATFGERLSALALIAMGVWSYAALRRRERARETSDSRSPLVIGLVHGIGGAGSLMLVLPVLVTASFETTMLFLFAFAAGSTLAMAGLTSLLAKLGARLARSALPRAQRALSALSIAVGSILLVA